MQVGNPGAGNSTQPHETQTTPSADDRPEFERERIAATRRLKAIDHADTRRALPMVILARGVLCARVFLEIADLCARPQGCTASAQYIADVLAASREAVQREITWLEEHHFVFQGGYNSRTGQVARKVRALRASEAFVWLPTGAWVLVDGRPFAMLAAYTYCHAVNRPQTAAEITALAPRRDGRHLHPKTVSRAAATLAAAGWLWAVHTPGKATTYTPARKAPQQVIDTETERLSQVAGVDNRITPPLDTGITPEGSTSEGSTSVVDVVSPPPAVEVMSPEGEITVTRAHERAREDEHQDHAADTDGRFALRADKAPKIPKPYNGPALRVPEAVADVFEPVRVLLTGEKPRVNVWGQRQAAREIIRQLGNGTHADQIRYRLRARLAGVMVDEIGNGRTGSGSANGWLLEALKPYGCANPMCEHGRLWPDLTACQTCTRLHEENRAAGLARWREANPEAAAELDAYWSARREGTPPPQIQRPAPVPRRACAECERPFPANARPHHTGRCRDCRAAA